jgi:hypothetical protein
MDLRSWAQQNPSEQQFAQQIVDLPGRFEAIILTQPNQ